MSKRTISRDEPGRAVVVLAPEPTWQSFLKHRLDLGDRISVEWLSGADDVVLDIDRLTEVTLSAAGGDSTDVRGALTVRVELSLLEQLFTTLTGQPPGTPITFRTGPRRVTAAARPWLAKIHSLITCLHREPGLTGTPWFQPNIEGWWIATGLLYAYQHNHSHLLPGSGPESPIITMRPPASQFIGPLLAHRRHHLGLSQSALADRLTQASGTPITQGRVSDYEHERHIPDDWLPHLSAVLGLPLEQLRRAAELTRIHRRCQL